MADLASKATLPPPLLSLSVFKIVDIVVLLQNNGYVRLLLTKHCNQNLSQCKGIGISVIYCMCEYLLSGYASTDERPSWPVTE